MNRTYHANRRLHQLIPLAVCRNCFVARYPDLKLVVVSGWCDDREGTSGTSVSHMDAGEIFDNLTESRYWDRSDATWADDLATVIDCLRENASEEGGASVYTEEEYAEHKSEQERQRLERTASQFARAHSVTPGTIEFFEALDRAQDREKSYREGLREDGLCATAYPFSSAGVEQWNEMNSDSYGRTADIRDVREWVQSNCPLLWLKYQEGKLQEANA